jgi:hypothetical protein
MAIPYRGVTSASTYFITAGTYDKMHLLQSDSHGRPFLPDPASL